MRNALGPSADICAQGTEICSKLSDTHTSLVGEQERPSRSETVPDLLEYFPIRNDSGFVRQISRTATKARHTLNSFSLMRLEGNTARYIPLPTRLDDRLHTR